ncbi:VOC family protein [Lacibacterium aquatile]|uniref:VOC family protein n=1 Tax=Lacibacterium aquatile TaxID=1168082 RepID=A0ABW5DQ93_9PROT
MLDHLSLGVADLARSKNFYEQLFAPLGYRCLRANEKELAFGTDDTWAFWLYPTEPTDSLVGARTHIAIKAPSRAAVAAAHEAGAALGGVTTREPGLRPDISPAYYGAILRDLDGHTIEITHWDASLA